MKKEGEDNTTPQGMDRQNMDLKFTENMIEKKMYGLTMMEPRENGVWYIMGISLKIIRIII